MSGKECNDMIALTDNMLANYNTYGQRKEQPTKAEKKRRNTVKESRRKNRR